MKIVIFTIVFMIIMTFTVLPKVYADTLEPKTLPQLYQQYNLIVHGEIISLSADTQKIIYNVKVNEYLKNPQKAQIITAMFTNSSNDVNPPFNVGDNVQLYLFGGPSGNVISPYSFKIDKNCGGQGPNLFSVLPAISHPATNPSFLDSKGNRVAPSLNKEFFIKPDFFNDTPLDKIDVEISIKFEKTIEPIFHDKTQIKVAPCANIEHVWKFSAKQVGNYVIELTRYGGLYNNKIVFDNYSYTSIISITNDSNIAVTKQLSPLSQFKSGIPIDEIKCKNELVLVIKSSNNSPVCVKSESLEKLRERGWAEPLGDIVFQRPSQDIQQDTEKSDQIITGLENDTGIITWKKQAYYFDTPYYTDDAYYHQVQIPFHGVNFTLFSQPFKGGLPEYDCDGSIGGRYYWTNAKFSDGTNELLHIFVNSPPCLDKIPIFFSNHTNPQAGLSFSDNKIKLLVSTDSDLVVPRGDLFLQSLRIEGLNDTYNVGQKIEFTVKFNGTKYGCYTHPTLRIDDFNHQKVWESNTIVELCDPDTKPVHFEKIWDTTNSNLGVPILNKTGTYTLFAEFEKNIIQHDFSVKNIESTSDEIYALSYICFNHDLSSNSTGVYLTCHNEEHRNIVYDLPDPVYKREDCKSTYGCASKYVWIPQIPKELISEEYKKQILEKVLNLPETKNWPAKSKLDHFNIGTSADRWDANIQFFVAGFKLPQHNHCEFYDSVNIDLETMEVTSGFRNFTNFEKC